MTDRDTKPVPDKEGAAVLPLKKREWYLPSLSTRSQGLDQIKFPSLTRPNVPNDAPPTFDLVNWGIQMYSFSLLSHYREMLRSFLSLTDGGNIPAGFVIARCLFEIAAHTYYVHKHVQQYLKEGNLKSAWEFLLEINMGNLYMKEKYTESEDEDNNPFPAPREIGKVIRCFNEWGKIRHAGETYSFLSEYSHPNIGAFSHHYEIKAVDETVKVDFTEPPRDPRMAPLPEVAISLTALQFVGKLLDLTGETVVTSSISRILRDYIDSRP